MSSKRIRRLSSKAPKGGMAFHGTSYGNAKKIKHGGFHSGGGYVSILPGRDCLSRFPTKEVVERTIGSILFAGSYSHKYNTTNPQVDDLPAIAIFKGKYEDQFFWGADSDYLQSKDGFQLRKQYRSFGKSPESQRVGKPVAIVRLTKKDFLELQKIAKQQGKLTYDLITSRLTAKVLLKLKKMIDK